MMDENFADSLRNAKTVDEFLKVIDDAEEAEQEEKTEEAPAETTAAAAPVCKVLAVTACPTGIAHTYKMCIRDSLQTAQKSMPEARSLQKKHCSS